VSDHDLAELAALAAMAASPSGLSLVQLTTALEHGGINRSLVSDITTELHARHEAAYEKKVFRATPGGLRRLLDLYAKIDAALDPSSHPSHLEVCPSLPWLTRVRTQWIDAVSVNYAVDPKALAQILPRPLQPELHEGCAWVQVLMSSLQDLRPVRMPSLFGTCFYQISYRAAVEYVGADGTLRRGGYFVRSDTNHAVMRAIGLELAEFKFHEFGLADMLMIREGRKLTLGVDPKPDAGPGRFVGVFDTQPLDGPPPGSVWTSLQQLHEPLVECYDALGVDQDGGYMYVLTIDRDPWNARFVAPQELYCEFMDTGPLGNGMSRLDSVLHIESCCYRWRPLRREAIRQQIG